PLLNTTTELPYNEFKQKVAAGQIVSATVGDSSIIGVMKNPQANATPATLPFHTTANLSSDPELVAQLQQAGVEYSFQSPPSGW
ncbi:MAG TPA: ATP-dependent metallopeptidase FtsH/Yme1/Tma family protein, partial [Caldilineaceae bacterium]|nr:ATP-dependent metallopeptidase FtsH/Yme1/Tma family protein [Caldilineaceae bacterium]